MMMGFRVNNFVRDTEPVRAPAMMQVLLLVFADLALDILQRQTSLKAY